MWDRPSLEVRHAVATGHLQVEEREPGLGPRVADEAAPHLRDPAWLVEREAEILHDLDALRHPLAIFQSDDLTADDPLHDVDLVLGGALSPEHPAGLAGDGAGEGGDRGEPLPGAVHAVNQVVAQSARRVGQDRWAAQRSKPSEVSIDRLGLFLGVGEDGVVNPLVELAVEEHEVEGGGLDSGPEVEDLIGLG